MKLVFVDETYDNKFKEYLGLCLAIVDARFYSNIKSASHKILREGGWNDTIEFKGSYLFSANKGCEGVPVETRIEVAGKILDLNASSSNSRMRFYYGRMKSDNYKESYLDGLPGLLAKSLPTAPKGAGKNLISIVCDSRDDISVTELNAVINPIIATRKYTIYERVMTASSSFDTVGLMYADLVGYLLGRVDTISHDSELFEGLTEEQLAQNGKVRKLKSSRQLISKIRKLSVYTHKDFSRGTPQPEAAPARAVPATRI